MSENQKKQWTDKELGMDRAITRRDFLDGVAVAVGALGLAGNASAPLSSRRTRPAIIRRH